MAEQHPHAPFGPRHASAPAWRRKENSIYYGNRREFHKAPRGRRAVYLDPHRSAVDQPLDEYRPKSHRFESPSMDRPLNARIIECADNSRKYNQTRSDEAATSLPPSRRKSPTDSSRRSPLASSPPLRQRNGTVSRFTSRDSASAPRPSRTVASKSQMEDTSEKVPAVDETTLNTILPLRTNVQTQDRRRESEIAAGQPRPSPATKEASKDTNVQSVPRTRADPTMVKAATTTSATEKDWNAAPALLAVPDWRTNVMSQSPVLVSSDSSSREPAVPTTEVDFARLAGSPGTTTTAPASLSQTKSARAEMTKKRLLPIRRKAPVEVTSLSSPPSISKQEAIDLTGSPILQKTEVPSRATSPSKGKPGPCKTDSTTPSLRNASPARDTSQRKSPLPTVVGTTPTRDGADGEAEMEISQDGHSAERREADKRQRACAQSDNARKKPRVENPTEDLLDLEQVKCDSREPPLDFDAVFKAQMKAHTLRLVGAADDGLSVTDEDLCIRWTAGAVDLLDFRDYLVNQQEEFLASLSRMHERPTVPVPSGRPAARLSVEDCERLYRCLRTEAEGRLREAERVHQQRGRLKQLARHVCAQLNVCLDEELTDLPVGGGSERQQLARTASSFELVIQPDIGVYLVNAVDEKSGRREIKRGELTLPYRFKTVKAHNDSLVAHALLCNICWLCRRPTTITAASYSREYLIPGLRGQLNARKVIQWLNGDGLGCQISFTAIGRRKVLRSEVSSDSDG